MAMTSTQQLDAVLPLTLRDAERADLLFESLALNFTGLRRIWVVCPDAQVTAIKDRYDALQLPFELCIESELNIVPEFDLKIRQSGWFRQQVIKLAIYERVASNLYLTLDADVVCTRPVTATQLIADGRGACFTFEFPEQVYWYKRIEDVLRIKAPRLGTSHNVTPALLHRDGVRALRTHIEDMISHGRYSRGLRGIKQRWYLFTSKRQPNLAKWRVFLMAARPWTEYALYYTFLEASEQFEQYHQITRQCIYDMENSLWHAKDGKLPGNWDPAKSFSGEGPPWFLVAQSNTGINVHTIRQQIQPLLKTRMP
jgi:hypothetical protein